MTENQENNNQEQKDENKKTEQEQQYSEIEIKAMSMGWKPKDQWHGDGEFIDAAEFVRRKPLFDRIEQQGKKVRQLEEAFYALAQHHEKVRQMEYQRALNELRQERKVALKEGNNEAVADIEDKIEGLQKSFAQEIVAAPKITPEMTQGPSPEYQQWIQHNGWYLTDKKLQRFADGAAQDFIRMHPNVTPSEVFAFVSAEVRREFPEKFENPNRNRTGNVSSSDVGGKGAKDSFRLSQEEERVAAMFESMGVMTREEYVKQLKELANEGRR